MARLRVATVWMGGCSGCHMSFLDLDEWLFELAELVDIVYTPIADQKHFPENVDCTLVEGAIANEEHLHLIKTIRRNSRLVVAFGDCAVTGNVTALRNPLGNPQILLQQVYSDGIALMHGIPSEPGIVPKLLDKVVPVHAVIPVDVYLQGCPPSASRIKAALQQIVSGTATGEARIQFG